MNDNLLSCKSCSSYNPAQDLHDEQDKRVYFILKILSSLGNPAHILNILLKRTRLFPSTSDEPELLR